MAEAGAHFESRLGSAPQKVRDAIAEAQVAQRQHQMVKQKSQRFVKVSSMQ